MKEQSQQSERKSPEYMAWLNMKKRCSYPRYSCYDRYGGRGIVVCERWRTSYANFLSDMGRRPSAEHSLDRIDNDGHYEPENCRWATPLEQGRNKRNNRFVTLDGVTLTHAEWARRLGCDHHALVLRLESMPVREALTGQLRAYRDRRTDRPRFVSEPYRKTLGALTAQWQTTSSLAKALAVDPGTLTMRLKRLKSAGAVEKKPRTKPGSPAWWRIAEKDQSK